MSDMRDFNAPQNRGIENPIPVQNTIVEPTIRPSGNEAGFAAFHDSEPDMEGSSDKSKIIGGIVVALLLGAAGVYGYVSFENRPKPIVAANTVPKVPPMGNVTPMAPPPAPTSDQTTPALPPGQTAQANTPSGPIAAPPDASASASPEKDVTAPVKSARRSSEHSRTAMSDSDLRIGSNSAADRATREGVTPVPLSPQNGPSQSAMTPLPTPPSPPTSSVASIPAQPSQAVEPAQAMAPPASPPASSTASIPAPPLASPPPDSGAVPSPATSAPAPMAPPASVEPQAVTPPSDTSQVPAPTPQQ